MTVATASTSGNVSTPASHASGSASSATPRTRSPAISTLRLRIRSTHAPAGRPTTRQARCSNVASRPISNSSAPRTETARSGNAIVPTWVPTWLIVSPIQSCRKSRPAGWPARLVRYQRGSRDGVAGSAGITHVMFGNRLGKVNQLPSQRYRGLVDPSELGRRPATDAEAKALASSLRLRILRMCLDEPMTNAQLAERLGRPPASVLHHVRTLTATGFLEALPIQEGPRGSRPVPYRATRKSWMLEDHRSSRPMIEAFLETASDVGEEDLSVSRLGLRLGHADLVRRLDEVLNEFAARPPDPHGRPWSVFVAIHPDPDRD